MRGPFVSRINIQEKVRTKTLIHSGSTTQANTAARQPASSRVSASASAKPTTRVATDTTSARTTVFLNTTR